MTMNINYLLTLVCILVVVNETVSENDRYNGQGDMAPDKSCEEAVTHFEQFVKESMDYLDENGSMFRDTLTEYSSGENIEVTKLCIFLRSTYPNKSNKLQGCVNIEQPDDKLPSQSELDTDPCSQTDLQNLEEEILKTILSESNDLSYVLTKPTKCTCPACVTSSTTSTQSTAQTTRATTKTASLSTSTESVSVEPNSDKVQGACSETKGLRYESGVVIGVTSFLAGVLVVLLFLWLLRIKRTSQLCFKTSEKPPQTMTTDQATKTVLATDLLSDRTDPLTQTSVLYFKNESDKKDLDPNKTVGTSSGTDTPVRKLPESTEESNISEHDYFVLQKENVLTSHQPDTSLSDNITTINEEQNERPANTYFVLEKNST